MAGPQATLNKSPRLRAPWFGMDCKAHAAAMADAMARICNAAGRPKQGCARREGHVQRCLGCRTTLMGWTGQRDGSEYVTTHPNARVDEPLHRATHTMTYINELVSDKDIADLDLRTLRQQHSCVDSGFQWTVDREARSWLMPLRSNPQDPDVRKFLFYWNGVLRPEYLRMSLLSNTPLHRSIQWSRIRLQPDALSALAQPDSANQRDMAMQDALRVFRVDGLYSADKPEYEVRLLV